MALPIFLIKFKQFLHAFSIKQITNIPYNPQTQDINTLCTETANKKLNKRIYTGALLSSLSRIDFTRF